MDKLFIIKIGGNIVDDESKLHAFLQKFATIKEKKILVHGGGKIATKIGDRLGIESKYIDGRRITDAATLDVVTMVYAGLINKKIVARLQANNCNAIGLSGADGDAILAHKRTKASPPDGGGGLAGVDYGFAGDIDSVNAGLLSVLLSNNLSIVLAPITHDQQGQLLNTNADTIAQEVAVAMSKDYQVSLIYCFEKGGVLLDVNDESSVIPKIEPEIYVTLKKESKIFEGMIPKLDNAFAALQKGVSKVIIGKAEDIDQLIIGTLGTTIINTK